MRSIRTIATTTTTTMRTRRVLTWRSWEEPALILALGVFRRLCRAPSVGRPRLRAQASKAQAQRSRGTYYITAAARTSRYTVLCTIESEPLFFSYSKSLLMASFKV